MFADAVNEGPMLTALNAMIGACVMLNGYGSMGAMKHILFSGNESTDRESMLPARNRLQQAIQASTSANVAEVLKYESRFLNARHEAHKPLIEVKAIVYGAVMGAGTAARKKDATEIAAKAALDNPLLPELLEKGK